MADWCEESFMKDEDFQEEEEVWDLESNLKATKSQKLKRYSTASSRVYMAALPPNQQQQQQKSSAPIRIPDRSKNYKEKTKFSSDECYEDGDDEMIPPHEYINRRVARSQIASFSMCEGVGRTLKGRDLSKLRNAILTKTGFLE